MLRRRGAKMRLSVGCSYHGETSAGAKGARLAKMLNASADTSGDHQHHDLGPDHNRWIVGRSRTRLPSTCPFYGDETWPAQFEEGRGRDPCCARTRCPRGRARGLHIGAGLAGRSLTIEVDRHRRGSVRRARGVRLPSNVSAVARLPACHPRAQLEARAPLLCSVLQPESEPARLRARLPGGVRHRMFREWLRSRSPSAWSLPGAREARGRGGRSREKGGIVMMDYTDRGAGAPARSTNGCSARTGPPLP